ncbi:hypothetical protein P692DRAFT_201803879 [Suillus brevipes Sb2]|nr:hypothetical protein P692DRAFT_201803879 [Suillus brevipes Sb2]
MHQEDAQIELPSQEIPAMPAPLLSRPPTLPSDYNEVDRTVMHQTPIGQDMLFSTSLEDVEDSQLVDTHTVRKYSMEVNLPLKHHSNEFAVRYFISILVLKLEPSYGIYIPTTRTNSSIHQVKDNSLPGYLILPLIQKYARTWNLFFAQAMSVVQCIREQWGLSLEDVVLCLFERDIPIKPSLPCPITIFESNRRPYGWTADKYEYADNELRCNCLLRLPHVRVAAAQAGGILWCLCKQELTNEIPNGPSADAVYFKNMSNDSSHMLIYDTLIYITLILIEDTSGLDTGYWNLSCEQIFQNRLEKIRNRSAPLLTTKRWRSDLKYYKHQSKKIDGHMDKECRHLLE